MATFGRGQQSYAGGPLFRRLPLLRDLSGAEAGQVVIIGAQVDNRAGMRAAASGCGMRPFAVLSPVNRSHPVMTTGAAGAHDRRIRDVVRTVVRRGALPVVLADDQSIADAAVRGCVASDGADDLLVVRVVDACGAAAVGTAGGQASWHDSPFQQLANDGTVQATQLARIEVRGEPAGDGEIVWAERRGSRWSAIRATRHAGSGHVVERLKVRIAEAARVWLSFEISAPTSPPASLPGAPEAVSQASWAALDLVQLVTTYSELAGLDLVETSLPANAPEITMLAHKISAQAITGLARRRRLRGGV